MNATLHKQGYEMGEVLYMALELSDKQWKVQFGDGVKKRRVTIAARDLGSLREAVEKAKEKFGLSSGCRVVSCYEAGRDGFWLHRHLQSVGIENVVVDSSSIEVSRRARRAKTDRLDAEALLGLLLRYHGAERGVWRVLRVPSVGAEDARRLHRERERLLKERTQHSHRIKSLLVTQGVRLERVGEDFLKRLEAIRLWDGSELPAGVKGELEREYARYRQVDAQVRGLERVQAQAIARGEGEPWETVRRLLRVRAIGVQGAWLLVMEVFSWRAIRNRRQLSALVGLVPTPYQSGDSARELGISKAGNRRVRALLIELAWLWLRYQPESRHTRWFQERFARGGKRQRRIGIVAVARRLLVDLWRYLEHGVLGEGMQLKST